MLEFVDSPHYVKVSCDCCVGKTSDEKGPRFGGPELLTRTTHDVDEMSAPLQPSLAQAKSWRCSAQSL